jgi:hemoglobin-like flavoprotein
MTPEQIKLVKLSFAPLIGRKLEVGKLFYQRLFEIAPDTKPMFKSDIHSQAAKLMSTLGIIIGNLHDTPAFTTMLEDLGRKHIAYGVQDDHYDKVRVALLWTLEKTLGDAFTDQARTAWSDLYEAAATVMRQSTLEKTKSRDQNARAVAR